MEDPWKYMADLPLEHVPTVRRYAFPFSHTPSLPTSLMPHPLLSCQQPADFILLNSVMVLIYHRLNPGLKVFPKPALNWTFLTRAERKRVKTMIEESQNNDLLREMLAWFSAYFNTGDEKITEVTQAFKTHVVNAIRQPKSYQVE